MKWIRNTAAILGRPGDSAASHFDLPKHVELGLSEIESAKVIADFFSKISQEYEPLSVESLPPRVQSKLATDPCDHPCFQEYEIYQDLLRAKKTCSVQVIYRSRYWRNFYLNFAPPLLPSLTDVSPLTHGLKVLRKNLASQPAPLK